jgi:hypothetical protein
MRAAGKQAGPGGGTRERSGCFDFRSLGKHLLSIRARITQSTGF